MSFVNAALRAVIDVALSPFRGLHPLIGLTVVSLLTAAAMLFVFKRTSDQARLAAVKRSIHAALFEIRLFNDDLRAIMRAQLEILRHNATYLRLSLVPMLWVIVPLVLLVAQLQFHYGYAAIEPGDRVLLKVQVREGSGDGIRSRRRRRCGSTRPRSGCRERRKSSGEYTRRSRADTISASRWGPTRTRSTCRWRRGIRRSPVRLEGSFVNQLLYPSEPPLRTRGDHRHYGDIPRATSTCLAGNWTGWWCILRVPHLRVRSAKTLWRDDLGVGPYLRSQCVACCSVC